MVSQFCLWSSYMCSTHNLVQENNVAVDWLLFCSKCKLQVFKSTWYGYYCCLGYRYHSNGCWVYSLVIVVKRCYR